MIDEYLLEKRSIMANKETVTYILYDVFLSPTITRHNITLLRAYSFALN